MSSILDQAVLFGEEVTYGTAVALTRGYEAKADAWKRTQEPLESVGMRAGMQTVRSDRRKQILMGAEGELSDIDFLSNGMGMILQSMLGTVAGPTSDVVTLATDAGSDPKSFTVQVLRVSDDGVVFPFTYTGAVVTSWSIAQTVGDLLKLGLTFDAQNEVTDVAAGTPTYPADATPFCWPDAAVSIGGSPVDNVTDIEFSGDLAMKTDRRFLNATNLKKAPRRSGTPTYTGSITGEFQDLTEFNRYIAGDIFEVEAVWTGADYSGPGPTGFNTLTVTAPACQYDGDSPVSSISELTTASMPFKILHDGTNPAITITIESADSAL